MRCSVAKVEKVYQAVRAIARKFPKCTTLDQAKILKDLHFKDWDWSLNVKEEKSLKRKCEWLGI